jgi:hypothetical protein
MACRLPGTIRCLGQTLYQSNIYLGLPNYSTPAMCNAIPIPCIGNTADQAVSTVHVQLGVAKHLTRPLKQDRRKGRQKKKHRQAKKEQRKSRTVVPKTPSAWSAQRTYCWPIMAYGAKITKSL